VTAIILDEPAPNASPVVKRTKLGERFIGALVNKEQRAMLRDGEPMLKPDGRPRYELVVTLVTMPGTTAPAGIKDTVGVPEPGDIVRMILRGKAYGDFIEATNALTPKSQVGDIVEQITDSAQVYDAAGVAAGRPITTQAELDAVPRQKTVGIYGPITVRRALPAEAEHVTQAEAAYRAAAAIVLDVDNAPRDLF